MVGLITGLVYFVIRCVRAVLALAIGLPLGLALIAIIGALTAAAVLLSIFSIASMIAAFSPSYGMSDVFRNIVKRETFGILWLLCLYPSAAAFMLTFDHNSVGRLMDRIAGD